MKKMLLVTITFVYTSLNATGLLSEAKTFERMCYKGNIKACHYSATEFADIRGNQYIKKSIQLLKRACKKNFAKSCSYLGTAYYHGLNATVNKKLGIVYYKKACSLDYKFCEDYGFILSN